LISPPDKIIKMNSRTKKLHDVVREHFAENVFGFTLNNLFVRRTILGDIYFVYDSNVIEHAIDGCIEDHVKTFYTYDIRMSIFDYSTRDFIVACLVCMDLCAVNNVKVSANFITADYYETVYSGSYLEEVIIDIRDFKYYYRGTSVSDGDSFMKKIIPVDKIISPRNGLEGCYVASEKQPLVPSDEYFVDFVPNSSSMSFWDRVDAVIRIYEMLKIPKMYIGHSDIIIYTQN